MLNRSTPYFLQVDKTVHPAWTGKKSGISMEDERIARVMKRLEGFIQSAEK